MNSTDTITAVATPVGSGGIGVIRISGPDAVQVASRIFRPDPRLYDSHTLHHGIVESPIDGEEIDDAVLGIFKSPKSYTGEDVIEISCHGGFATVRAVLNAALDAGARLAEPGEFTRRAFLNGRIDLAQAEAVNDIIRARTDEARKIALRQLDGKLSDQIKQISTGILGIIAAVEASIDFPDDVPEPDPAWIRKETSSARDSIGDLISTFNRGRIYREGIRVVIAGTVNVGKSSLLNALLRAARAIVTPIPGTTRDVIEESMEIAGIPIVAIDTAGLRATSDPIEQIGVELSKKSIESADLMLGVFDASAGIRPQDEATLAELQAAPSIAVLNKIDLATEDNKNQIRAAIADHAQIIETSAHTGDGIPELEDAIARKVSAGGLGSQSASITNIRHKRALESAFASLGHVIESVDMNQPIDLLSGDLIAARNSLGLITGETATEDLLDRIFNEFCIGK